MGSFHISNPCYCLLVLVAIMAMGPNGAMSSSIVDILSQQDQFSFLVRAINALGLADTLGSGQFTIFAPTNAAFQSAGPAAQSLMSNPAELKRAVMNHVVNGAYPLEALQPGRFTSMAGGPLDISNQRNAPVVNGVPVRVGSSIMADNGVIHIIDKLLLP